MRRRPYSVVLLDEIEKAHPDVFNILLQVLDDGRLTDNKGRVANFKNTIIIMTSNLGSHLIQEKLEGLEQQDVFAQLETIEQAKNLVMNHLKQAVRPEFLNRVDEVIMFRPLTKAQVRQIVDIQFGHIRRRLAETGIELEATPAVLDYLGQQGFDPQFGARPLKRTLQRLLLNELSKQILAGRVSKEAPVLIELDAQGQLQFVNVETADLAG